MKATVILEADGSMTILAPYNNAFIKALKDVVPYNARPYDEDAKTWRIRESFVSLARAVVCEHYDPVRVVDERPKQQAQPNFTYSTSSGSGGPFNAPPPGAGPYGPFWGRRYQDQVDEQFLHDILGNHRPRPQAPAGPCTSPSHHTSAEACVAYLRQVYPARAKLHVLPGAPAEVIAAAYRALSRSAHPDVGGSTKEMQDLNQAYASLKS